MNRRARAIAWGVGVLATAGAGYVSYQRMYAGPRQSLDADAMQVDRDIGGRERAGDELPGLRKRLEGLARTTLGSDEETVAATLRTALNEIVAHHGLKDPTVATRRPEGVKNPAALKAADFTDRAAKNRPDFYTIAATVRAVGSREAVLRTLATLEHQPWVHRIDSWTLTPVDKGRDRFAFTVELTSVFLPERELHAQAGDVGRVWEPVSDEQFEVHQAVLARAMFKQPPPDAPPPAPPAATIARVDGPPYEEWRVTGVVRGRTGWELWVKNAKSGQTLTLMPGDRVLDAKFLDAAGETATVEIGGARYSVALGQTLGDRRPARQ